MERCVTPWRHNTDMLCSASDLLPALTRATPMASPRFLPKIGDPGARIGPDTLQAAWWVWGSAGVTGYQRPPLASTIQQHKGAALPAPSL